MLSTLSLVALLLNHARRFCNPDSQNQLPNLPEEGRAAGFRLQSWKMRSARSPLLVANAQDITLDGHPEGGWWFAASGP